MSGWKVSDPAAFFPRFAGSANPIAAAEALLDQWLGNAKTAVVGKHPLADFLSTSDNGASFVAIEKEILAGIQSQLQHQQLRACRSNSSASSACNSRKASANRCSTA